MKRQNNIEQMNSIASGKRKITTLRLMLIFPLAVMLFIIIFLYNMFFVENNFLDLSFLSNRVWAPEDGSLGMWGFFANLILISVGSAAAAVSFSFIFSVFIISFVIDTNVKILLHNIIEFLAGLPSIVYAFMIYLLLEASSIILITQNTLSGFSFIAVVSIILGLSIIPKVLNIIFIQNFSVLSKIYKTSKSIGAKPIIIFFKVILPIFRKKILGLFLVANTMVFSELVITLFLLKYFTSAENQLPNNTLNTLIFNHFMSIFNNNTNEVLLFYSFLLLIIGVTLNLFGNRLIKEDTNL